LAPTQEFPEQGLIQSVGFVFVDAREIGARELSTAKMIEPMRLCGNILNNIP
jgi:hypothetical protein